MNIDRNIYHELLRKGLTTSQREFSRYYLGMAENYACLRGVRGPSERALINLFRRLWSERHYLLAARVGKIILWGPANEIASWKVMG
jgi:hypothetical protein